jgi:hypothetical protein
MDSMKPALIVGAVLLVLVAVLAGCTSASAPTKADRARSLNLFAFNYTDRGILNITVDGMWMGIANAYKQGGGAMGPRPPRDLGKQHSVEVKWEISASYYDLTINKYVRDGERVQRSASVPIKFPYPETPTSWSCTSIRMAASRPR